MSLEQRIRDVLAEASILAEASASAPDKAKVSHGKAEDSVPSSAGTSTYDTISRRFERCRSRQERLDTLVWAKGLIAGHKRRQGRTPTTEEYRYWLVQKYEGKHYADVAREENISTSYVRKIREEHKPDKRDPLRGRPVDKAA